MIKTQMTFVMTLIMVMYIAFSPTITTANEGQAEELSIGAYNHLTLSFSLLRHGRGADHIRRDILSNVDLAALQPELRDLYKQLLNVCNDVISSSQRKSVRRKEEEARQKEVESQQIMDLANMVASGGFTGIASMLWSAQNNTDNDRASAALKAIESDAELRNKISEFEFQLSIARSDLRRARDNVEQALLTTEAVDRYIALQQDKSHGGAFYQALNQLVLQAPALYPASLELGVHYYQEEEFDSAKRYLKKSVSHTPKIISRSDSRSIANAILGVIEIVEEHSENAERYFSRALDEQPDNPVALKWQGRLLAHQGRYEGAEKYLRATIESGNADGIDHYALAQVFVQTYHDFESALEQIRLAFQKGFSDIEFLERNKALGQLRALEEFKALTQMQVGVGLNFEMLTPDIVRVENKSAFDLTNVTIEVLYRIWDNAGYLDDTWYYEDRSRVVKVGTIKHGESYDFWAFDSTKTRLAQVLVTIKSGQGAKEILINNEGGKFFIKRMHDLER